MEVKRKSELKHERPVTRSGEAYPYAKSARVFHTDQIFLYSEVVAPGKKASAPHFHKEVDEVAYIVKGVLHAHEGETETVLTAGDSVLFRANSKEKHHLENKSDVDAEFLILRCSATKNDVNY